MNNDLNIRQREVACLIEDWPAMFAEFGCPVERVGKNLVTKCPSCQDQATIRGQTARGYPTWSCGCGAHQKHFDSYLGLLVAVGGVKERGKLLGEVEAWALSERGGELPDWIFTFGKYEGKKISEVPANYALWAAKEASGVPLEIKEQILHAYA